ncbi:hypothetical protein VE23_14535 [Paenibacillus sp. D9]|nr:hypothetical protein VE23_14535 [Paenibacillus sp. D9]CDN43506.1 hypothetical protein BN871_DB_00030 [Paenibacillus sp. P22]
MPFSLWALRRPACIGDKKEVQENMRIEFIPLSGGTGIFVPNDGGMFYMTGLWKMFLHDEVRVQFVQA